MTDFDTPTPTWRCRYRDGETRSTIDWLIWADDITKARTQFMKALVEFWVAANSAAGDAEYRADCERELAENTPEIEHNPNTWTCHYPDTNSHMFIARAKGY